MDKNRNYKILSLPNHILEIETEERPKKIIESMKIKPKDSVFFKRSRTNLIYAEFESIKSATDCSSDHLRKDKRTLLSLKMI